MASSVGTITADFDARSARFAAELTKIKKEMQGLRNDVRSTQQFFKNIAKTAVSVFSARAFVGFVQGAADAQEQLADTADSLGITTTALKALQLVTTEAGGSIQSLEQALVTAQRGLGQAAAGTGDARKFIAALNLDVETLRGLAPEELFLTYADAISNLGDQNQQVAAAQALFGKSSVDLLKVIRAGRPAFEEAATAVAQLGLALDPQSVALLDQAGDSMGRLREAGSAFGARIALAVAPALLELSKFLLDASKNGQGLQDVLNQIVDTAVAGFLLLANVVNTLKAAFFGLAGAAAKSLEIQIRIGSLGFASSLADSFGKFADANLKAAGEALRSVLSIEEIQQEIIRIREAADAQARAAAGGGKGGAGGGVSFDVFGAPSENFDRTRFDTIQSVNRSIFEEEEKLRQNNLAALDTYFDQIAQKYREGGIEANTWVQKAAEVEIQMRANVANAALGFLNVLAQKSKAAAIASILLNRGLMIAQAIQNTAAAVTRTLASVPYPANIAAAAHVQALGTLQIGLIAATGALEVGNALGGNRGGIGGSGVGTPANPLPVASTEAIGAQQNRQITIRFEGVFTSAAAREMAEAIKDVVDNSDVHIIGSNSSQARELRGT